jgi:haloalkane dehalogenase
LHGEPTWSFAYRKLVRAFTPHRRVIAADFAGFGRSDKPAELGDHTLQLHVDTVVSLVEALDLCRTTLVVHDWGGLIGLASLPRIEPRIANLVIMNSGLPVGAEPVPQDFLKWRRHVQGTLDLPVGKAVQRGFVRADSVDARMVAAYDAPFPDQTYKAGPRALPLLVPLQPEDAIVPDMRRARAFLGSWRKPALVLFSDRDPMTSGWKEFFQQLIPSARDYPETVIRDAGHFLQEEKGEAVAQEIAGFLSKVR